MREGMKSCFPFVDILDEANIEKALAGVADVLKRTGVVVKDRAMRKTLRDYGCKVDDGMERVYMDKSVIDRALASCPKGFEGTAIDPNQNFHFRPGKTIYFTNACGTNLVDVQTGEVHTPSRKEFYDYIRLLDSLPNVDIQNCFPLFGFEKVPECMKLLESAASKYRVSGKAQIEGTVFDNYRFSTEMAKALGVDMFQICSSAAPLTYFEETADQIRTYSEADLPFHFAAGPTRGMTSPMSAMGSAISNNAETMAGIVMAQAVKPGNRVWVNSMIMTPNMHNGKPAFGDIGNSVTDMIFNQMWRKLGIPCWSNAASWTSSKIMDYQAGYELTMALMAQAMSGTTLISYQSGLYAELTVNGAKAIIDDDIVGMLKRLMNGPDVTEEAYALDLIHEVGPMPGSFMSTDLTLENWRDECYIPIVANRQTQEEWERTGKKTILDKAREKEQEILAKPLHKYLNASQEDIVEQILKDAREYYRKKGMISEEEWKIYEQDFHSEEYPYA